MDVSTMAQVCTLAMFETCMLSLEITMYELKYLQHLAVPKLKMSAKI